MEKEPSERSDGVGDWWEGGGYNNQNAPYACMKLSEKKIQ